MSTSRGRANRALRRQTTVDKRPRVIHDLTMRLLKLLKQQEISEANEEYFLATLVKCARINDDGDILVKMDKLRECDKDRYVRNRLLQVDALQNPSPLRRSFPAGFP